MEYLSQRKPTTLLFLDAAVLKNNLAETISDILQLPHSSKISSYIRWQKSTNFN